jgi:hypothetical protein
MALAGIYGTQKCVVDAAIEEPMLHCTATDSQFTKSHRT